jgi:ectoine hydroxylase-related dioxygenase (phytanoyl-CoA dioxygenase family)
MRVDVSADEVAAYREVGFLVIDDFLAPDDLDAWREAVGEACQERGWRRFAAPNLFVPDQEALTEEEREAPTYNSDASLTQRLNLWQTNEKVRRLMLDEQLGKLVADLAGVDGVRIYEDRAMIKKPFAQHTSFHQDSPHWAFHSPNVVQMWVALEDATLQNGCLYLVPGTHKNPDFRVDELSGELGALFDARPEWKDIAPVPCPLPAGGAVFFNGCTVHGAGCNMTLQARLAMSCHFFPDGCTFNGVASIYPPEYLETLSVGDFLDHDDHNPLVFSRTKTPVTR